VGPDLLPAFERCLSPPEIERARRYHFAIHRDRFIAARGYLRQLLARYQNCAPGAIKFRAGGHGKPETDGICFNLAHAEDRLLIAVAPEPVGVDLEKFRSIPELEDLAAQVFAPAELASWPEPRLRSFLRLWTRKEALLKGIGLGITEHLKAVAVFFETGAPPLLPPRLSDRPWWIQTFEELDCVWSIASAGSGDGFDRQVITFSLPQEQILAEKQV
jgi:4'-phosphopantetheinyl transferase